ncbi:GNAT family N-acetyltransferase [Pseudaestuariivita atlantica]|uniref:GNAT family N-acetyltransferase n=1 Tax=Pseudaestuariivita atlantica TaxID=1317121 RepID=UPI001A943CA6|nr:GNAT family N-acetyltransferase [Pseudaestuariivita atlantica]
MLKTRRLVLRRPVPADGAALRRIADDPLVARWLLTMPHPYGLPDAQAFIARVADQPVWLVEDDSGPVGVVNAGHELGFWFTPRVWGRGYAGEASAAALDDFFHRRNGTVIPSSHAYGNSRSQRVLVKLGFSYTGQDTPRKAEYVGDDVVSRGMRLTRDDWTARTPVALTAGPLVLRPMQSTDAEALRDIVTQASVGRMLFRFPPDWTTAEAGEFIAATCDASAPPFRLGVYADDRLIGSVGVDAGDAPDVFYFLDPAAQGQGYGRAAMVAFCANLFARFGLASLTADVFTDNPASDHILRSIGFERTGTGMGTSAARVEPAPIWLYRLTRNAFEAAT